MRVTVRNNNVMQAFSKLKKQLHNEGVIEELRDREHFTKPSDAKREKRKNAIRRQRSDAAKRTDRLLD